jgi:hypothetical protein
LLALAIIAALALTVFWFAQRISRIGQIGPIMLP